MISQRYEDTAEPRRITALFSINSKNPFTKTIKESEFSPCLRARLSATAGHGAQIRKRIYNNAVSVAKHNSKTRHG